MGFLVNRFSGVHCRRDLAGHIQGPLARSRPMRPGSCPGSASQLAARAELWIMKAASQFFIFCGKDGSFAGPTSSGGINASPHPRQLPSSPENSNLLADPAFPEWNFNSMGRVLGACFVLCLICSSPLRRAFLLFAPDNQSTAGRTTIPNPAYGSTGLSNRPFIEQAAQTMNHSGSFQDAAGIPSQGIQGKQRISRRRDSGSRAQQLERIGRCGEEDRKAESG